MVEGAWYYDSIRYAYENGLIAGYPNGLFGINDTITRGQIATILWRMEESPVVNYAMTFEDVGAGMYYAEAIRWAASEGIVGGYTATQFGPDDAITREQLAGKTRADALRHPNWTMGAKITVDSATLMNKGLEIIEAMRLYRLPLRQVDAIIHRQSIVHSLVEYRDGAMLAQLGTPDMKLPIRYAMTYPYRAETPDRTLDLLSCPPLTFAAPDEETFRCLKLARQCAAVGGTACAILNGANEEAVGAFLRDAVGFNDISALVEAALETVEQVSAPTLEDILAADHAAREAVRAHI